jgi:integrase
MGLETARQLAREAKEQLTLGNDPTEQKKVAQSAVGKSDVVAALTVDELIRAFVFGHVLKKLRTKTQSSYLGILGAKPDPQKSGQIVRTKSGGQIMRRWGGRRAEAITAGDIKRLIGEIKEQHPAMAAATYRVMMSMWSWADQAGIFSDDYSEKPSPFSKTKTPDRVKSRAHVLKPEELRVVWAAMEDTPYPFGPYFKMLTLTAQRRQEVAGMEWQEISWSDEVWLIPEHRTKNGLPHLVPLTPTMMAILRNLRDNRISDRFVFTTTRESSISGFSKAKRTLDAKAAERLAGGIDGGSGTEMPLTEIALWRVHDLRRTASTIMPSLGVSREVVDKLLNHVSGEFKGVSGVYNRYEYLPEKRDALLKWDRYLCGLTVPVPAGVTRFADRRAA